MASKTEVAVERRNLSPAALYEHAVRRGEAAIVSTGALTAETGKHTGRSPKDKFFVRESTSQDAIWWHPGNQPIPPDKFDGLVRRMQEFIATHEVYTQDVFACADARYRLSVRVITELAWHSLFARNLFIRPNAAGDDVALFFGLSGTGKTTLSAEPSRRLIGDDEHGWSDRGVFNFEGGCYAKTIRIHKESEPEIYAATESFGTILENVVYDPRTRVPDYDSEARTENTRAAYPIDLIPNAALTGTGQHPHNVMFLSADAYGVLPPVARLDEDQIRHYFLSGYTAKVAGTERGVTEPEPIFSTCFAAPFLVLPPERYADMLIERVKRHHVDVWMLNTGWVGGPYGVGERMSIAHTRAIVRAVLQGDLRGVSTHVDPIFGLHIPNRVPGVPREVLDTRDSWPDPEDYDRQAAKLRDMFERNIQMIGKSGSSAG